jgi:hypothetical protein
MLSSLPYAKFRQLLDAKCHRAGIELLRRATWLERACCRIGRNCAPQAEVVG